VSVVMSFDLFAMHDFVKEFNEFNGADSGADAPARGGATTAQVGSSDRPKMLLLTCRNENDPENEDCQYLSVDRPLPNVTEWLVRPDSKLDGLYIQFEDSMVDLEPSGLAGRSTFKSLCEDHTVGVWGHSEKNPDRVGTAKELIDIGAVAVNTDLPRDYCAGSRDYYMVTGVV